MKKRSFHKKLKKLRINFGNKLKKLKRKEMQTNKSLKKLNKTNKVEKKDNEKTSNDNLFMNIYNFVLFYIFKTQLSIIKTIFIYLFG